MKKVISLFASLFFLIFLSFFCTKLLKKPTIQKEPDKKTSNNFNFNDAEVIGYLDNPTPVYILDASCEESTLSKDYDNYAPDGVFNTEEYDRIYENGYKKALKNPLSTFSIDVDGASYANARRFINNNTLPLKDAVRIEEFINYFTYNYKPPLDSVPFALHTELSECLWNKAHNLLKIGIQGRTIELDDMSPNNLVFLLDVSGSMSSELKLPLLKKAFCMLVEELRPQDRVAIVVYAGAAGCILSSTPGNRRGKIINAINRLESGGSTAGGEGIRLAYNIAKENFISDGNNRVILATDGDFNVGVSSDSELVRLIEKEKESGVYLTVLGFGMGNYKDSKMEKLANKGNGNYAYIDNILEANKVLVRELCGTLYTIAKDVKIQIEFNPTFVDSYRLIGYENRLLNREDFNDDKNDAGELGAGHTVTVLYELVLRNLGANNIDEQSLKYQETHIENEALSSQELATLKLRYKEPLDTISQLVELPIENNGIPLDKTTNDYRFACAVASFGMILRDSKHRGNLTYNTILQVAQNALGEDKEGYRHEFTQLVNKAKLHGVADYR